jgi:type II secretory pathway component GspD/PulD (secretin)
MRHCICAAAALVLTPDLIAQDSREPQVGLAEQIELIQLLDLCSKRIALNIEYDPKLLQGATVTLRLGGSISDEELWSLTNQLLAVRGFATVQPPTVLPGEEQTVISVVKLADAPGLARVELPEPGAGQPESFAGFTSVVVRIQHRSVKDMVDAVKLVLSQPGGSVSALASSDLLLISDLRGRVDQAMQIIEQLDVPMAEATIEKLPAQFINATQLAAITTAAATSREAMDARPLRGKLAPVPDGNAVILIAPPEEVQQWKDLIARFDERQAVERRTYAPRHFSVGEVARLIEQTARDSGPRGAGDRWRLISDDLTGTLIVTATPGEHEQIQLVIDRLNAMPIESRRPVRAIAIRNRSVTEILEVLNRLIEAGVLDAAMTGEPAEDAFQQATQQRTERLIFPPAPPVQPEGPSRTGSTAETTIPLDKENQSSIVQSTPRQAEPSIPRPVDDTAASTVGRIGVATGQPALMLTADEGTNTLIAVGDPRLLSQLEELIRTLDVRQPQVMIEVLVVSLSDAQTLDLGVELQKIEISGGTIISLSSLFGLAAASAIPPATLPTPGSGFTGVVLNPGDFSVLIRALQTLNKGKALNIPKVLVSNNQQATLDSVLEQPFISTNASDTVATTSFGGTQDAGTTVTIKPQIAEGDHLVLEYAVALSTFVGDSSDPTLPPPRQKNSLASVVTIPDGYTVVVGGLEIFTETDADSQVPWIGDVPILGEAFKSRSRTLSKSRFFVFIRSTILRHQSFEDLKFLSDQDVIAAGVDDGWPEVEPRVIR